jgi:tetratricopeptide (TPR) repeat protein
MHNSFPVTFKNITVRVIVSAIFIWGLILPFFAKTASSASTSFGDLKTKTLFSGLYTDDETMLTTLQAEARNYRQQGVEYQRIGDLDTAMAYYQKAIELDPVYTVAFNDLGIIYEAKGMSDRAEESYLRAIKINPNYLSSYSNLALLYESKRDLLKAAEYWKKRVELGPVGDPWTEKAKTRLNDIRLVLEDKAVNPGEDNVLGLMNDVLIQKASHKTEDKTLARKHLDKAKTSYKKGDSIAAVKEAYSAKSLDPANRGVDDLLDNVQMRMLSR